MVPPPPAHSALATCFAAVGLGFCLDNVCGCVKFAVLAVFRPCGQAASAVIGSASRWVEEHKQQRTSRSKKTSRKKVSIPDDSD
mmetsp:Transcript_16705/g.35149  ORF Transcript_16705/g.35149 Transcript_16705/m.35149 type:complete len:84 (-) Transcript_16705:216-467(-)